MRRLLFAMTCVYAAICLFAVARVYASAHGLWGMQPDPLSALYAMALALPWGLALLLFDDYGSIASTVVLALGMAANIGLLAAWLRVMRR